MNFGNDVTRYNIINLKANFLRVILKGNSPTKLDIFTISGLSVVKGRIKSPLPPQNEVIEMPPNIAIAVYSFEKVKERIRKKQFRMTL